MHEVRATMAPEDVAEAARLAHASGIERVAVSDVYIDGPNLRQKIVSVETSTPNARLFVEALLSSPVLSATEYSLTSRELRAIVDRTDLAEVTRPMSEPFPDVIQDLWQLSHVTASYVGRAAAGGILLATGIIDNNAIAIVVAALFLPFLAEVLAVSFGLWTSDWRLILRGVRALMTSAALAFLGGLAVAWFAGGPVRFAAFKSPLPSFAISAVIGITAGLSNADDTGRRYLIGVAAAVQLAIFPAWLGAAAIIGLPPRNIVDERLLSFAINLVTISATAVMSYAALHMGRVRGWQAPRSRH
ncbi:MAG TPA: DUF389 domain-containing protein [Bryobacteraceae bacterium]|nr:DUF389 domain-containing protein [Bryobacteraceae bacterium]